MKHFFDPLTSNEWRAQFLHDERITYVLATPAEQFAPSQARSLSLVYESEGYTIYQVVNDR
jgi:hypothetical protein